MAQTQKHPYKMIQSPLQAIKVVINQKITRAALVQYCEL